MATKYYHAENCNRHFHGGIVFKPYDQLGGTWRGLFATDDAGMQAVLDGLSADPRTAVKEITKELFEAKDGAKTGIGQYAPTPQPYEAPAKALPSGDRLSAKAGVVNKEPPPPEEPAPAATSAPLATLNEALVVENVEAPPPSPEAAAPATATVKPPKPAKPPKINPAP